MSHNYKTILVIWNDIIRVMKYDSNSKKNHMTQTRIFILSIINKFSNNHFGGL